MNSKQRRRMHRIYILANEEAARVELVARTLDGVPYRNLPRLLREGTLAQKVDVIRHLKRPQRNYTS